jgi:hypothetical protein
MSRRTGSSRTGSRACLPPDAARVEHHWVTTTGQSREVLASVRPVQNGQCRNRALIFWFSFSTAEGFADVLTRRPVARISALAAKTKDLYALLRLVFLSQHSMPSLTAMYEPP